MILNALGIFDMDASQFLQACASHWLKPTPRPFWQQLPFVHIYCSITPDILHQMYQGIMKHLIQWTISVFSATEIDACCCQMPPNHNLRLFSHGVSTLSHVTGQEHDQMCWYLLGLVINIELPGGLSNARLLCCMCGILDFLYYSQYPVHTDTMLYLMQDALNRFHINKKIFIDLGIRDHFNILKFHFVSHYIDLIKLFGTTDNFNTQYTEQLHIDYTKIAYVATNKKDEYKQMTRWLKRKEKIQQHEQYIKWCLSRNSSLTLEYIWRSIPPSLDIS
jgi:Plavaka transposase